jgi:hypothetical protein
VTGNNKPATEGVKRDVRKFQAVEANSLSIIRIIKWMGRDKIKDKDAENVWK